MKSKIYAILAVFAVLLLYGTMVQSTIAADPKYGGTLVIYAPSDPPTLNPCISVSASAHVYCGEVYNGLLDYDMNYDPIPALATSWQVSSDGLTYTFNLVRNATWHDGVKFTSADVKFSYEKVMFKYHSTIRTIGAYVAGIDTPDDYTVIFRLNASIPTFIQYLGQSPVCGGIIAVHLYNNTDILSNPYNVAPIGTGAFMFKEWVKGDHVTFVRNPNYFRGGLPYLQTIIMKIIPDINTAVSALKTGEIDYIPFRYIPLEQIASLRTDASLVVQDTPAGWEYANIVNWVLLNTRRSPLDNILVRQAMQYVANKTYMWEKAQYSFGKVAISCVGSQTWGWNPNTPQYPTNVTKANALLDQAGFPKGSDGIRFHTSVYVDQGYPVFVKCMEIWRSELSDVGIDLEVRKVETATMNEMVGTRWDFDMVCASSYTRPDPVISFLDKWTSRNLKKAWLLNVIGYNNSVYDDTCAASFTELNTTKRQQEVFALQTMLLGDAVMMPMLETANPSVYRNEFHNVISGIFGKFVSTEIGYWDGGISLSPSGVLDYIQSTRKQLLDASRSNYDVADGLAKLDEAQTAYNTGDFIQAYSIASQVAGTGNPPYLLYGTTAAGFVTAAIAIVYAVRKKPKQKV